MSLLGFGLLLGQLGLLLGQLGLLLAVGAHLFQSLCVCSADEVGLHVINATLWVHQVLVVFSFDLNHAHDHTVDHVDRLTLVFFTFSISISFISAIFYTLAVFSHLILGIIFMEHAILDACAPLIKSATIKVMATHLLSGVLLARLKLYIVEWVILTHALLLMLHLHSVVIIVRVCSKMVLRLLADIKQIDLLFVLV